MEIAAVADTHVHNDYVSGALGLARRHGADYLLAADESVAFERVGVRGGDVVDVGALEVHVHRHPRPHPAPPVLPRAGDRRPGGAVQRRQPAARHGGRTDLVDEPLTRRPRRSPVGQRARPGTLHPATRLHPTHGFGSFCASSPASTAEGGTHRGRPARQQPRPHPGPGPVHRGPGRRLRPGPGVLPAHGTPQPDRRRPTSRPQRTTGHRSRAGRRTRRRHLGHRPPRPGRVRGRPPRGAVSVEYSQQFATYVGWLVPWGEELIVTSDHLPDLAPALRDLASIGIEGVGTHVSDPVVAEAAYRRTDWTDFRSSPGERVVVDVRQRDEFEAGHLPGALHVPVQDVELRAAELPRASSGSTAAPATGPASRPASCTGRAGTSCTWTTPGTGSPSWRSRRPATSRPERRDRDLCVAISLLSSILVVLLLKATRWSHSRRSSRCPPHRTAPLASAGERA